MVALLAERGSYVMQAVRFKRSHVAARVRPAPEAGIVGCIMFGSRHTEHCAHAPGVTTSMFQRDPSKQGRAVSIGAWIALGAAVGCSVGVSVGSLPIGVGLGIAVAGFVAILSRRRRDGRSSS